MFVGRLPKNAQDAKPISKGPSQRILTLERGNVYIKRFCGYHIKECIAIKVSVERVFVELEAQSVEKGGYSGRGQYKRR
jgi:hypothetical protein